MSFWAGEERLNNRDLRNHLPMARISPEEPLRLLPWKIKERSY